MALPLYLAMTAQEMTVYAPPPRHFGIYAPPGSQMPPGAMLILDDRISFRHDPQQIAAAVRRLDCGSVLLDFEGKPEPDSIKVANALFQALPCPVAAPPGFLEDTACPVFLPPCPLHVPLAEYLDPWRDREIWLDVTMRQMCIAVTPEGTRYGPPAPADRQAGGWFDPVLLCRCISEMTDQEIHFTLLDTPETLARKLDHAASLGVSRAVGLYQELYIKL